MADLKHAIAPDAAGGSEGRETSGANGTVDEWIVENPDRPGADDVRVRGFGVTVWALIGHQRATGVGAEALAEDYELPIAAVHAALAYYEHHRQLIDERLAANSAPA